ncbi:hypothetical protein [Cytophaga aurantiaca]|uniref:hypothetical protein n=1 Tax=Cytophaga aurantiaca TaxID=29530 RepID=UPI00036161C8|nr:hypothetical protein [Cytophaga aurantiaca]
MKIYVNDTGESTITHYEIGEEYIRIKSKNELVEYNVACNPKGMIEEMKVLARKGKGLSRYVQRQKAKKEIIERYGIYERFKKIFSFV